LVERLRAEINSGAALDLDSFMKLKASAAASKAELFDGLAPEGNVDRIIVEYVSPSNPEMVESINRRNMRLQEEIQRLQQELWQLRSVGTAPAEARDPSLVSPATPPPAVPSSSNIVSIAETAQQRKARLEQHYGASQRPYSNSYPADSLNPDDPYRRGSARFDNKL
jgi:hypothetical protein